MTDENPAQPPEPAAAPPPPRYGQYAPGYQPGQSPSQPPAPQTGPPQYGQYAAGSAQPPDGQPGSGQPDQPQYGAPPPYGVSQGQYAPPPRYGVSGTTNEFPGKILGLWSFLMSLAGLIFLGPILWVAAIIVGAIAVSKSKKAGHGNGFARAGIWISVGLIVLAILLVVLFFTVLLPTIFNDPALRQAFEEGFCGQNTTGPGTWDIFGYAVTCE